MAESGASGEANIINPNVSNGIIWATSTKAPSINKSDTVIAAARTSQQPQNRIKQHVSKWIRQQLIRSRRS